MTKKYFMKKLDELDLKVENFAEMTGIRAGSIYSWSDEKRPIPSWVEPFLNLYERARCYENLRALVLKIESKV